MFRKNCCMFGGRMPMPMENNDCCERPQCPIVEPTINKCIEREFCHEVQQE
mgnify:FL=1